MFPPRNRPPVYPACLVAFLALLLAVHEIAVAAPSTSLIFPSDTTWRFRRGTSEASLPVTAWRGTNYNDSAWEQGPAPFLYTTALSEPPFWSGGPFAGMSVNDMLNTYTTIYLRKSFVVTNAVHALSLTLTAASDDGFIAWLNGVEIARRNVTTPSPPFNGTAASQVTEPQPIVGYVTNAVGLLRDGTNVLAVHALNALFNSSDFAFMASLSLSSDINPPQVLTLDPPANAEIEALTQLTVTFNQPISGVDAADLRINGVAAAGLADLSPSVYRFMFPQPPTGSVAFAWVMNTGITNSAGDAFAGGAWTCVLNTNLPPVRPYIAEFLADNRGGLRDEDGTHRIGSNCSIPAHARCRSMDGSSRTPRTGWRSGGSPMSRWRPMPI